MRYATVADLARDVRALVAPRRISRALAAGAVVVALAAGATGVAFALSGGDTPHAAAHIDAATISSAADAAEPDAAVIAVTPDAAPPDAADVAMKLPEPPTGRGSGSGTAPVKTARGSKIPTGKVTKRVKVTAPVRKPPARGGKGKQSGSADFEPE